jgi:hypothetical protein
LLTAKNGRGIEETYSEWYSALEIVLLALADGEDNERKI